jgi:predicted 3-demethylubiquinone-9 3-methyltransferase (glyoxalase superfamily)
MHADLPVSYLTKKYTEPNIKHLIMKPQKITPCLWVEKDAKKAAQYYLSIFKKGKLKTFRSFKNLPEHGRDFGTATINILGMDFQILAAGPLFKFNEAVSFVVRCKDQVEVDYYWKALTAKGGSEGPCGWLKDKYGLSWQIVPKQYFKLEASKDKAKRDYALQAVLKMKKIIIADLMSR